jgi:hypothetical protein
VLGKDDNDAYHFAGVAAGRTPEFIEMMRVGVSRSSGSAQIQWELGHFALL